jgi:formyltetrahydrofolate-dependent phosphoribosylglycinamide formyltransferase
MAKARVAVLISGRGSNMAALIYAARHPDCPFEIVLVTGDKPDAPGLGLAEAEGVPIIRAPAPTPKDKSQFYQAIDLVVRKSQADYIALAGYMRILPPDFVDKWQGRMLNIHPSLLPKYKGLDTHERALADGEKVTGCSVHLVTAELDDGEVLGQTEVAILPGDTPDTLAARVLIAEHQLYSRVLADYVAREQKPDWLLDQLRKHALTLPSAEERTSHGSPGFAIAGGKFFAMFSNQHHNDGIIALLVKTSGEEEQAMLIDQDEEMYYRPQYYGPSGWIGIRLDLGRNDWDHISEWLRKSWLAVAPPKLRKAHALADEF